LSLPLPPPADDPFGPYGERSQPFFIDVRPAPRRSWWREWGQNVALFVLTALSVYATQAFWWGSGHRDGLLLMAGLMSILLAHEMGHYIACRYYRVDATLPFFLPVPVISLVGTLGAFIRIRSRFPNRRALFDIGIAGPLAGFAVCIPVLVLGIREARVLPTPAEPSFLEFSDPLLIQWTVAWLKGTIPEGHTVFIGPLGLAAWFGLLVTALNLIPIGQLDGGHVTYALLGRRADRLSRVVWWISVLLILASPSWVVWAVLVRVLGRSHPPTWDDALPLGLPRVWVALLGFAIFAVCFVPSPFVNSWPPIASGLRDLLSNLTSR